MSIGRGDQIERKLDHHFAETSNGRDKPWGRVRHSHKWDKKMKHKRERQRAKRDPECHSEYRKYYGWEW